MERAGTYFPHDEFYDARIREAASEIAVRARPGARVASETPGLVTYYARLRGREDILSLSLSETEAIRQLETGDFVIVARGRRYFSNEAEVARLLVELHHVAKHRAEHARGFALHGAGLGHVDSVLAEVGDAEVLEHDRSGLVVDYPGIAVRGSSPVTAVMTSPKAREITLV